MFQIFRSHGGFLKQDVRRLKAKHPRRRDEEYDSWPRKNTLWNGQGLCSPVYYVGRFGSEFYVVLSQRLLEVVSVVVLLRLESKPLHDYVAVRQSRHRWESSVLVVCGRRAWNSCPRLGFAIADRRLWMRVKLVL